MKIRKIIPVIDVYAVGMLHRVVVGGAPNIYGKTMKEKQHYLEDNLDDLRTLLVKGADEDKALVAALITEPTTNAADVGFFIEDRPVEAMRRFITWMLVSGIPDKTVERIVKLNARELLY